MNVGSELTTPVTRGFTRLEVLGVSVGIALLASLELPLLATHRDNNEAAMCLDNQRRLALAWQMYALDGDGWYPPNPDDGNTTPGFAWVGGSAGPGGGQEFNPDVVVSPRTSMLADYLHRDGRVFRCPSDTREGRYQGAEPALRGKRVLAARTVAMNVAVGTNPYRQAKVPTDGSWLDNNHGHFYGQRWYTYGRDSHFVAPGPGRTFVFTDEDALSLNDGIIAFGMAQPEWIDWPATYHDQSGSLAFADGHAEIHRWVDDRTVVFRSVARRPVPGSADYAWLRERTSAEILR